jgi:hypothetical protein
VVRLLLCGLKRGGTLILNKGELNNSYGYGMNLEMLFLNVVSSHRETAY